MILYPWDNTPFYAKSHYLAVNESLLSHLSHISALILSLSGYTDIKEMIGLFVPLGIHMFTYSFTGKGLKSLYVTK